MCRKVDELTQALSSDERGALEMLGQEKASRSIPYPLAERLMNLGLAEVSFGGLDLTVAGRMALDSMRGH